MKILIAHNRYQHRGGEDVMVEAETELLRSHGHELLIHERHNDDLASMPKMEAALQTFWSSNTVSDIQRECLAFAPDVIHVHNTFPLISPSLYWIASKLRIPVVQTLHNFRLVCPQAMLLRDGRICEDCVGKLPWRGVVHRCYRDSAAQSAVVAGMLIAHGAIGTWDDKVTRYIALNEFCRERFVRGGLPPERLRIKPNFVQAQRVPDWERRRGGLFVGRLSFEKGLEVLIRASELNANPSVQVIGDGPLKEKVLAAFGARYLGYQSADRVQALLHKALYLVAPSTCYETFGLAALEAFSCGTAVIASRHGGLGELVTDGVTGLLVKPGDAVDLAEKLAWADAHPDDMMRMGQAARLEYEKKYSSARNYRLLMEIYQEAIASLRQTGGTKGSSTQSTLQNRIG
ncbi:MAG: glycosyltransferase [Herminiimonas sp.]|nr:glycosyltransferase [Herminiimonas sp.]MDB5853108.1 glycosyltransferase [Herminiimonas sp.]